MAFKTATIQAFKKGFMEASPVLLEPIASVKVTVPDDYTGDVMGDLNKRRGRVLGMTPVAGGKQVIEADIPMRKHTRDKITEQIVPLLNDLQRLIEVRAGKIIRDEISNAPIILMTSTTVTAVRSALRAL